MSKGENKMRFKVGEYVEAKGDERYTITTARKGFLGRVVDTRTDEIRVEVIDHKDKGYIGEEYRVKSKYFKHSSRQPIEKLVIADLFNLYKTPSNKDRRFETPFDKIIYYDGEGINVSSNDWLSPEDITDIYTSFDMMDIEVTEIKEVQKEMTIEEIEKELGYKIKVVGD